MDMENLLMTLIDVDTWNEALWKGVLFLGSEKDPPAMGLFYLNEKAGRKIFTDLIAKIGNPDKDELLRLTIIEGSIPDEEPGYSVYLGPDLDNIFAKAERDGVPIERKVLASLGRFRRMNPTPGSPFLSQFKASFKKNNRFSILPAFGPPDNPRVDVNLAIRKTQLQLRQVEELTDQDPEFIVFTKNQF